MPVADDRDSYDDGAAGYNDDDGASGDYGDGGYGAAAWQDALDDGNEAVGSREYIAEIELALAGSGSGSWSASGSSLNARAEAIADVIRAGRVHPLQAAGSTAAAPNGVPTPPDSALPQSPSQTSSTTSTDRAFGHLLLSALDADYSSVPPLPWHLPRHASAPWHAPPTTWRARAATADTPSSPSTSTGGSLTSLARDLDLLSRAWRASRTAGAGLDSRSSSGSDLAIDPITGRADLASRIMPATPHLRAHAVPSPPPLRVRRGLRRSETSGSMCSETSSSVPDGRRSRAGMLATARVMTGSAGTSATSSSASLSITLPAAAPSPAMSAQTRTGSDPGAIAAQWIASWVGLPAAHARRERFRLLGCRPGAVGEDDGEVGVHTRRVLASAGAKRPAQWRVAMAMGGEGCCRTARRDALGGVKCEVHVRGGMSTASGAMV
ncbi:hypothetical protein GGF31_001917 [Allomyces arbusculus]|nr:hypothetical protein GGF31_001917 [Allomyces arbusculus]